MRKLLGFGLAIAAILLYPATASAGSLVVLTLDPMPPPAAGEEIEVGFTVRERMTPVNLHEWSDEPFGITTLSSGRGGGVLPGTPGGPDRPLRGRRRLPGGGRLHVVGRGEGVG